MAKQEIKVEPNKKCPKCGKDDYNNMYKCDNCRKITCSNCWKKNNDFCSYCDCR